MTNRAEQVLAFLTNAGWGNATQALLAGDASSRAYRRLKQGDKTAILMDADPTLTGPIDPFVTIARAICAAGLSAPRIYALDPAAGFALIEDLGDALFANVVAADPAQEIPLYCAAIHTLWHLHNAPLTLDLPRATPDLLTRMLNPFFDDYLPYAGHKTLPQVRQHITQAVHELLAQHCNDQSVVILRDFHAENLLWLPNRTATAQVGLLDFQDALWGHPVYDIISLTQDARRDVCAGVEGQMLSLYAELSGQDYPQLSRAAAILGVQRNLRILGIFARLAQQRGKPAYLALIPRVLGHIDRALHHAELTPLAAQLRPLLQGMNR